jgi:puromycin-sensitive aminopeptidase
MKQVTHLVQTIKPTNYDLDLTPDLSTFTFAGKQNVTFKLLEATKELIWHGRDLEIQKAVINNNELSVSYNKDDETITLTSSDELASGEYVLEITYTGEINDSLHGWYRSKYEQDGETKWLATTQLEATSAREAFICIDEPSAKATFDVTLHIDESLDAISNGQIVKSEVTDGVKSVKFEQTPIMSTYLLAFLVGEFEYIETINDEGVVVRVYTVPGKKEHGAFALDVAAKTLSFYKDYFGIAYPLPKLDMIAVPDFAAGAMENWGAVTYRETALLVDDNNSSLATKQWAAMVVAHELAHQWFGNLVTMGWWTDLWLNEGFASWVEYLAVDHLFPEWNMWTQFVTDDYAHARDLDALDNTHPVEVEVYHPHEVDEIFDAISYQKGASVIRMLHEYLGETDFKTGLHDYLAKHSYGNAVTADLWAALEEASGKPVSKIMGAWTSIPGHPVIWFDHTDDELKLHQERFFADPKAKDSDSVWPVPVEINGETILMEDTHIVLPDRGQDHFKPNRGQTGFYVVGYTSEWLDDLAPKLQSNELAVVDKFGILTDTFDLIKAGKLDSVSGLQLIANLRNETDMAVWDGMLGGLGSIMSVVDDQTMDQLEVFGSWLAQLRFEQLGWEPQPNESHFDALLRPRLIGLVGRHDEATLTKARELFEQNDIHADIRGAVYGIVARFGDEITYDKFYAMYKATQDQEEQGRLTRAMAQFKQPALAKRTLEFGLSDEVRAADSIRPVLGVIMNRYHGELGWQFIQDNWKTIEARYGQGGHLLTYFVDAVGGVFNEASKAQEIKEFFAKHPNPGIDRKVKQAIERTELRAAWRTRDLAAIKDYLATDYQERSGL